jgi:Fic family protein
MHEALAAFERYLRASDGLPFLVRLALLHYQFEAIHPFIDGNGRVGRLLIPLLLCEHRRLPSPLLYLSAYLERRREEYYARLLAVSQHGEWERWIAFFLQGVAEQSLDAVGRAGRLRALEREYERRLQTARSSALLLKLVQSLFVVPALTIAKAARRLGVTPAAASKSVSKLVQAGILAEATGRARNRVFVAREIVRAVEEDLAAVATAANEPAPVGTSDPSPP